MLDHKSFAKELIYNLRNDYLTRKHFNMGSWTSSHCNTVGCIAGTAVAMAVDRKFRINSATEPGTIRRHAGLLVISDLVDTNNPECHDLNNVVDWSYSRLAEHFLNIPFKRTADDLFQPPNQAERLVYNIHSGRHPFDYLPDQARPAEETVEAMRKWAKGWCGSTKEREVREGLDYDASWVSHMYEAVTPNQAAFALERVVIDEVPYANWAEAFENA